MDNNGKQKGDFSVDLGWLLQNQQIEDAAVCDFLFNAYSLTLERFISTCLGWGRGGVADKPSDAARSDNAAEIVDRSITSAIINRAKIKSEESGRAWLYRYALRECLNLLPATGHASAFHRIGTAVPPNLLRGTHFERFAQGLAQPDGLLLFLQYGVDLSPEEIAELFALPAERVRADCHRVRTALTAHREACPQCSVQTSRLADIEIQLRKAFQTEPALPNDSLARRKALILEQVTQQQKTRQNHNRLIQAAQAGVFVILLLVSAWLTSRSLPGRGAPLPAAPQAVNANPSGAQRTQVTRAAPAPTAAPTQDATLTAVLKLAAASHRNWLTLWADVRVIQYGPGGTTDHPQQMIRKQVWIKQPGDARLIYGSPGSSPSGSYSITGGRIYEQDFQTGQTSDIAATGPFPDADLQKLFSPPAMFVHSSDSGNFHLVGGDTTADRPVWIVDETEAGKRLYRYWIDSKVGVILRRQEYGGVDYKTITADTIVTTITYGATFAPALFQPYQYPANFFAHDFSGAPEITNAASVPIPHTAAEGHQLSPAPPTPRNFDPANSQIYFEIITDPSALSAASLSPAAAVFAGPYYLGRMPLGGPGILNCQRSPDGRQIAYTSVKASEAGTSTSDTTLSVANLNAVTSAHPVLPGGITAGDFAFAPDSLRLAFFGCDKASGFCGVFILDTLTGSLTHLIPLTFADYMFWSSGGRQLALVGRSDAATQLAQAASSNLMIDQISALAQTWHFIVLDSHTGAIAYKQPFDWSTLLPPADAPSNAWPNNFKVRKAGAGGCVNP